MVEKELRLKIVDLQMDLLEFQGWLDILTSYCEHNSEFSEEVSNALKINDIIAEKFGIIMQKTEDILS